VVWVPIGRDGNHVLRVGRDRARTQGVGQGRACGLEVGRDEARTQGVGRGGAHGLGVGRGGALPQRSSEAELACLGVSWSCSRALDCSDESMLMVISSSYSGTLVLVPDKYTVLKHIGLSLVQ